MSGTQTMRLASGGRIDRERSLQFLFNGTRLEGHMGDTLASALLANDVCLVGRGLKYHRPRGIMSAGGEESNAIVTVGEGALAEPNVRATLQPLYQGLTARSQNCWPSVRFDVGRVLDFVHGLWAAGFYNKTFIWPRWSWYEGAVRRAAGLGSVPPAEDPDTYEHRSAHCDVLVVGAGPAGLAAALAASESGRRVMLIEQDRDLGGSLLWGEGDIDGKNASRWLEDATATLRERGNLTLLAGTTAGAYFDHQFVLAVEKVSDQRAEAGDCPRERLWRIHADETILATGAIEQPLVFPHNDRPGIMLASGVLHYLRRYAVTCGRRVVIATNNDSAYALGGALLEAGIEVAGVLDSRPGPEGDAVEALRDSGVSVIEHAVPVGTAGGRRVSAVKVGRRRDGSATPSPVGALQCDCLAMAGGWQPAVHLLSQARGTMRYDDSLGVFVPDRIPPGIHVAGACTGHRELDRALEQGWEAGRLASGGTGTTGRPSAGGSAGPGSQIARAWVEHSSDRQWIDFMHDVTLQDVDIAVSENFVAVEHLKRHTTTGMAVDQGKTSNINALVALAERTGRTPGAVGTTTFRPFFLPVTLGVIAGRRTGELYAPVQRSPMWLDHERLGAEFQDYGSWRRPAVYPLKGETRRQAMEREAIAARTQAALFDGSPLGKIEVRGGDAAEFLNRNYVNNVHTLAIGKARYGLMLNENGIVVDDGILVRLAETHFLVHTSSGAINQVLARMEELSQADWPQLDVLLTNVTSQWANVALSGPRSRELLTSLPLDIDTSNDAFPHMGFREASLAGVPARIMRASFTGELGYEISVPADYGSAVWQILLDRGEPPGITPIGVETLMLLRTEKGFPHIGTDTDGNTTAADLGWEAAIARKEADFLGRRSLCRPANTASGRLQLVGLTPASDGAEFLPGAHLVAVEHQRAPAPTQGYVTSAFYSPNLGRWVALGLVRDGRDRIGEEINVFDAGVIQRAFISRLGAWDPEGERLRA